jgi:hypothetical protein
LVPYLRRELDFFFAPVERDVERDDDARLVRAEVDLRELDFLAEDLPAVDFLFALVERPFLFAAMNYSPVKCFYYCQTMGNREWLCAACRHLR